MWEERATQKPQRHSFSLHRAQSASKIRKQILTSDPTANVLLWLSAKPTSWGLEEESITRPWLVNIPLKGTEKETSQRIGPHYAFLSLHHWNTQSPVTQHLWNCVPRDVNRCCMGPKKKKRFSEITLGNIAYLLKVIKLPAVKETIWHYLNQWFLPYLTTEPLFVLGKKQIY